MSSMNDDEKRRAFDLFKNMQKYHLDDKVAMIRALEKKYGSEIYEIITKARNEQVQQTWTQIAARMKSHTIKDLIKTLWESFFPLFEYTVNELENGDVQMEVTKCFFADLAKESNVESIGYYLWCIDDPPIVEGFGGGKIGLKRTKTLMQGDSCCDHCYFELKVKK